MKICPMLNKECVGSKCMWWVEMIVKNIQTGEMNNANDCAISKLPGLLVEGLRATNGVQASVESHRNENVKRQDVLLTMIHEGQQRRELADSNR